MRDEFQTIEWVEPPIGDLVGEAMAQGRRRRTVQRLRVGGVGAAVIAVTGLAAGLLTGGIGGTSATQAVSVPVAAAPSPSPSPSVTATGPKRVKGTPQGILELLVQNLPKGKASKYVGFREGGDVTVRTYLDRGHGPGMITLNVMKRPASAFSGTWTPLANGAEYMVKRVPGNCVQHTIVWVHHPDDTLLQFNLANCLDSTQDNKKSPQILTAREAAEVGADSRWGVEIDPALNEQGAADFPHLPSKPGK